MGWGLAWILGVADWITGLEGAITPVVTPGPAVLPLLSVGALIVILWQGRSRWFGLVLVILAGALWAGATRPALLVAPSGGLVGVLGPEGRALSKPRGNGFAARVWLENDGDPAAQEEAASRPGWQGQKRGRRGPARCSTPTRCAGLGPWPLTERRPASPFMRRTERAQIGSGMSARVGGQPADPRRRCPPAARRSGPR